MYLHIHKEYIHETIASSNISVQGHGLW